MTVFVTSVHVLVCLILIVLVLLQKGKGAEIGAVFGGSSASTLFGSRGAGNFLTKLTTGSAVVFLIYVIQIGLVLLTAALALLADRTSPSDALAAGDETA